MRRLRPPASALAMGWRNASDALLDSSRSRAGRFDFLSQFLHCGRRARVSARIGQDGHPKTLLEDINARRARRPLCEHEMGLRSQSGPTYGLHYQLNIGIVERVPDK